MTDNAIAKGQMVCHCLSCCPLAIVLSVIVCHVVLYPLYGLSLFILLSFSHCIVCHCLSCCPLAIVLSVITGQTMTDHTMAKRQQDK
jgi:hypothetical protein